MVAGRANRGECNLIRNDVFLFFVGFYENRSD